MKTKTRQYLWTSILLEYVKTLKYIGATLTSDGSLDNELRNRLATSTLAMVIHQFDWKLWNSYNFTFHVKYNL